MSEKNKNTVRIQKYLANRGIASRRKIETMVRQGLVTVNGRVVEDLPCFVDPAGDTITVDGKKVAAERSRRVYYLVNKPRGYICTSSDPEGRRRVHDLIPPIPERVYCVGRLDADSTGLVILTNDGSLTNRLTHPRYGVEKTYLVNVPGKVDGHDIEKIIAGQYLDGKKTNPDSVRILRRTRTSTLMKIGLREGKNREIRRLLAKRGYTVRRLRRIRIGPISDRGLKTGNFRPLTTKEVSKLKAAGS